MLSPDILTMFSFTACNEINCSVSENAQSISSKLVWCERDVFENTPTAATTATDTDTVLLLNEELENEYQQQKEI